MDERRTIGSRVVAAATACLCLVVILWIWRVFFGGEEPFAFIDIDYYRNAVSDVSLGTKPMHEALPYPPFAFLFIWWLVGVPVLLGNQIWTAATFVIIVLLILVLTVLAARATDATAPTWTVTRTSGNTVLMLVTWPILSQLGNGQLSILMITLAFIDAVGILPRRLQGVLVGLAGAIKLTPLIFVLYFIVTGQRRQAAAATGTFGAASALAWAIFPQGSLDFWTHVGTKDQFGEPSRLDNLSIHSTLARISTELGDTPLLWMVLGAVLVGLSMWRGRRHFQRGEVVEAVLVVGSGATVVAPIAWPHYFVWLPLAGLWLIMTGERTTRLTGWAVILCTSVLPSLVVDRASGGAPVGAWIGPTLVTTVAVAIGAFGLPRRGRASGGGTRIRPDTTRAASERDPTTPDTTRASFAGL